MTTHHDPCTEHEHNFQEAQKQQQEFISMIVHELRTPLSGTKWTLKMLLDGDLAHFSEDQLHILREGYRSNERMVDLLEELSRANKAQVWNFHYNLEPVNIEELIEDTITQFLPAARARQLSIKFQRPSQPIPSVQVDVAKMTIVMEHIIENGIKYSPDGSDITVTLSATDTHIVFSCHNPGTTLAEGDHAKIFQKYSRGSLAQASQIPGTGMGLFTVKKIIEDQDGTVTFTSNQEEGTMVGVELGV